MTVAEYNHSVELHADGLYRFLLKSLRNEEKARDFVQDAFERLWMKVHEIAAEKAKSYLFATAYHVMIDTLRRDNRFNHWKADQCYEPHLTQEYTGIKEILENALERLPADQRSVILLRDFEGYSYQEIAEITGLSESQVKVYIFRGRMFLKNHIGSIEAIV
jgi:RNA polymerase sigma-70 factor (ECF subfamily)